VTERNIKTESAEIGSSSIVWAQLSRPLWTETKFILRNVVLDEEKKTAIMGIMPKKSTEEKFTNIKWSALFAT
jgi:hypothetical protein